MSIPPIDQRPTADPSTRRLQRSPGNKMIAGVAGGIAEYANVDPLLVRVLLGVLTVFGGAGILLYALGWLLLPAADQEHSLAESLLGRGRRGGSVLTAIGLTAVVVISTGITLHRRGTDLALVVLSIVGGVLIYRHLNGRGVTRSETPPPAVGDDQPVDTMPLLSSPLTSPYATNIAGQSMEAINRAAEKLAAEQLAADDRALHGPWPARSDEPTPPEPKRRRSFVGALTLSAMAVVLGALGAVNQLADLDLPPIAYLATALAVVGVGLVIGAFRGGARWLILPGIPLAVAVVVASLMPWHRHVGYGRDYQPATVADIQPHYRANAGEERLDLSKVDFTGHHVRSTVELGTGQIDVVLPRNVDITVHAHGNLGDVEVLSSNSSGPRPGGTYRDLGPDGPGGGTLELDLNVGVGQVEVSRVA
ncbi:MAG TPA: PspC domain-containing protein [Mycobacteriales bacterium]|nr:PspC domain-containing protein [Mycobacteriales bacterium]